jgi:hypothetical protein
LMERVFVVGAGIAGLSVAAALGGSAAVQVIERLPAVGGTSRFDHPLVRELARDCCGAGVEFLLGTTALRWVDHRLLVAAPGLIRWLDADLLVYAGGTRPGTAAEIRLVGSRLGGVVPATVAVHLLEARTALGRRPVIIGASDWAKETADHFHHTHLPVRVVSKEVGPAPEYADEWWPGWAAERVLGHRRVEELQIGRNGHEQRLMCDAVVLADGIRPLRNVDGALVDGDDATFVQLPDPYASSEAVVAHARGIAGTLKSVVRTVAR